MADRLNVLLKLAGPPEQGVFHRERLVRIRVVDDRHAPFGEHLDSFLVDESSLVSNDDGDFIKVTVITRNHEQMRALVSVPPFGERMWVNEETVVLGD